MAAARPAGECHLGDSQGDKNAGLRTEEVSEAIPRFPGELWMENRSIEVVGVGIGVKVQPEKRAQLCGVTELRGARLGWELRVSLQEGTAEGTGAAALPSTQRL